MSHRLSAVALALFAVSACSEAPPDPLPASAAPPEGAQAIPDRWLVEFATPAGHRADLRVLQEGERATFWGAISRNKLSIEPRHDFSRLWNGVSVRMPRSELPKLLATGVVKAVF